MIQKHHGFSLIEMMVALGISTMIMLGVATAITTSLNAEKNVSVMSEVNQFMSHVTLAMQNPTVCEYNFKSLPAVPSNGSVIAKLHMPNGGGVIAEGGNQLIPGSLTVRLISMEWQEIKFAGVGGIANSENRYLGKIRLNLQKSDGSASFIGGNGLRSRDIPVLLKTNVSDGSVKSCNSLGMTPEDVITMKQEVCSSMNGIWDSSTFTCTQDPALTCAAIGGQFIGGNCSFPTVAAPPSPAGPGTVAGVCHGAVTGLNDCPQVCAGMHLYPTQVANDEMGSVLRYLCVRK